MIDVCICVCFVEVNGLFVTYLMPIGTGACLLDDCLSSSMNDDGVDVDDKVMLKSFTRESADVQRRTGGDSVDGNDK